ncbi:MULTISPECIES: DUF7352 domain-containing protein [Bacillaceae]|uniref:DUF7352 domain-containing protein n=1 Tax=Alkalicoccobacillus plakortidis TaxID=444060 RepID=A0A9D5DN36_9BACI|nr:MULTISPECIES: hypothetical protein [Bacillaceae]KQL55941.1 hypothetical protein AN965_16845 [Alkalicoccobacillus plakortidis]
MKSIFKYNLKLVLTQNLELPEGAKVLSVANQKDQLVLWAIVDPKVKEMDDYTVVIGTTGDPLLDTASYMDFIGTVMFDNDTFVAHVFCEKL